jgi:hypothetical protein
MTFHPHCRPVIYVGLAGILIATLIGYAWRRREPAYQGKSLTEWLYNSDPDFVWMPNDLYGHIHNELWDAVLTGGYAARNHATNQPAGLSLPPMPDPATVATRQIGTNAIPLLLELMAARPSVVERSWDYLAPKLPGALSFFLNRTHQIPTAERRHVAACNGFQALGTNAESALPALSNLLQRPGSDFELGCAIAGIGPKGRTVLVHALTNSEVQSRRVAAFCLGNDPEASTVALPVLVSLVERGQADYQVLGAIGRLGGNAGLVVPALTRFLERTNCQPAAGFEAENMAILILGLYRDEARSALPVLLNRYADTDTTTRQVIRVVVKNIDPPHAQQLLGRAPTVEDDADPWWNGPQN